MHSKNVHASKNVIVTVIAEWKGHFTLISQTLHLRISQTFRFNLEMFMEKMMCKY